MNTKLNILFYVGIIVPTAITVGFFIGFLVCWFQCNLRERLLQFHNRKRSKSSNTIEHDGENVESTDKASQHSADSAIDVNELELTASEEKDKRAPDRPNASSLLYATTRPPLDSGGRPTQPMTKSFLTEADIQNNISKGMYPSHEKLNEEIHSEPRIYETPEDLEIAMYNGFEPDFQYYGKSNTLGGYVSADQSSYTKVPHKNERRTSYSGSDGRALDNHATDYGFAPWQRSSSVCSANLGTKKSVFSLPKPKYKTDNICWNKSVIENSTNCPMEILHV